MKAYNKMFINGEWREGTSDVVLEDVNPFNGETLFTYKEASRKDVDDAYAAAVEAQKKWSKTTVAEKVEFFEKLLSVTREYAPQIEEALMLEGGSTLPKRGYEAATCAEMVRYFMAFPPMVEGKILPSVTPGQTNYVIRKPKGVITVISPWNVPCLLGLKSILPAIATGNAVVVKPSTEAPSSALILAEIFEKAGAPAGLINVVVGRGSEIGDYMVQHPQSDLVSFTGSTAVGKRIAALAGDKIGDISLELGGNNAMLVLSDADIEMATEAAIFGAYFHQGQICMGVNRAVVLKDRYQEFCETMQKKVAGLKAGDPKEADVFVGPLINSSQVKKFETAVGESIKAGARVLVEGSTDGNLVSPWLLADVTMDMATVSNETFGPLCNIISADTEEEAIAIINDTTYGLSNSVFSADRFHAMEVAAQLESGMVHVNDQTIGEEFHVMFGAEKQSGVGRFNGKWVLEKFTTEQWISVK